MSVGDEGEERDSLCVHVRTCEHASGREGRETGSQAAEEGGLSVAESCA